MRKRGVNQIVESGPVLVFSQAQNNISISKLPSRFTEMLVLVGAIMSR